MNYEKYLGFHLEYLELGWRLEHLELGWRLELKSLVDLMFNIRNMLTTTVNGCLKIHRINSIYSQNPDVKKPNLICIYIT